MADLDPGLLEDLAWRDEPVARRLAHALVRGVTDEEAAPLAQPFGDHGTPHPAIHLWRTR